MNDEGTVSTRALLSRVRRLEIRTRKIVDHLTAGAYHSVFKGQGIEFNELREYQPGDDVRAIDWNTTARFARPYIKKFTEERELTVMLLVDVSASQSFGSGRRAKIDQAVELAVLLAFSAVRNQDRVGMLSFSSFPEFYLPPRKGRRQVSRVARELLGGKRRAAGTDIGEVSRRIFRLLPQRAVVFLISDMLAGDYEQPLAALAARHDLVVTRITDPRELSLPPTGFLTVEDAEKGEFGVFNGRSARKRRQFAEAAKEKRLEVANQCRRSGIDLIDIFVDRDVVPPLMRFFRAREHRLARL